MQLCASKRTASPCYSYSIVDREIESQRPATAAASTRARDPRGVGSLLAMADLFVSESLFAVGLLVILMAMVMKSLRPELEVGARLC